MLQSNGSTHSGMSRSDIVRSRMMSAEELFLFEKDTLLRKTTSAAFLLALGIGLYLSFVDLRQIATALLLPETRPTVKLVETVDLRKDPQKEQVEKKSPTVKKDISIAKKSPKRSKQANRGGNYKARVTKIGIFGAMTDNANSRHSSADIFGRGGPASGIDKILRGVKGIEKGDGGPRRLGESSIIGDGSGFQSGFTKGNDLTGDVNSLMDELMNGGGESLKLKKKRNVKIPKPDGAKGRDVVGKRSRSDIMRVVNTNMASLRYIFNRHLRERPGMKGKLTVKWAIDEFGKVIFCKVVSTTIKNKAFEDEVVRAIRRWKFRRIHVAGDVTEVIYPFVFTQ